MINKINDMVKRYFYIINYNSQFENGLCNMEMRSFFNFEPEDKNFFADRYVNPSRSPFIKEMIGIIYEEESVEEIINKLKRDNIESDRFKVCYMKVDKSDITYEQRLNIMKELGMVINGEADIHNPQIIYGIAKVKGKWIFGVYEKNDFKWHIHDKKPCTYSNSLSTRVARALVNIVCKNDNSCSIVDPCCGVGTVVIEALSLGMNIRGYELNPSIAENAARNVEFFGYDNCIENKDMKSIREKYDCAIIDLPYGLFTPITHEEQIGIINHVRKITDRLLIVTFEDMEEDILNAGFNIIDRCSVCKGKFKRYISVCE